MYTALTIGVSVIGLMIAVRWGSRKKFLHFLLLAAVSGGALLDLVPVSYTHLDTGDVADWRYAVDLRAIYDLFRSCSP